MGASREVFRRQAANAWVLIANHYVIEEVEHNVSKLAPAAQMNWPDLKAKLSVGENVLTAPNPVVFQAGKDRPILFSSLAYADVLLTWDVADFMDILGHSFYSLQILKPGDFLHRQRALGKLQ
jgi:hypothetical protein